MTARQRPRRFLMATASLAASLILAGCVSANDIALRVGAAPPNAAQLREVQTARFNVRDEHQLLSDATQALQDLGFILDESSPQVGVLAGSKSRDATEAGQVAAQVALTIIAAAFLVAHVPTWDTNQTIVVTLTTRPVPGTAQTEMRTSFERVVRNNRGMARSELLMIPDMYRDFYVTLRNGMAARGIGS